MAVVHDADELTTQQMADVAKWTNLSETTFLSAPTDERADYRVRIFTTRVEIPFAVAIPRSARSCLAGCGRSSEESRRAGPAVRGRTRTGPSRGYAARLRRTSINPRWRR